MSKNCPRCGSHHLAAHEPGRRLGSKLGALTGATLAVVNMSRGAQVVATTALVATPIGGLGALALAALFAGSAGGALGGALGKLADQTFLDDRKCLGCGFTFRAAGDDDVAFAAYGLGPQPGGPQTGSTGFERFAHEEH